MNVFELIPARHADEQYDQPQNAVLYAIRQFVDSLQDYVHRTDTLDDKLMSLISGAIAMHAGGAGQAAPQPRSAATPDWASAAEREYSDRRRRELVFATEGLFGEPSWDILLDVFYRQMRGQQVSVTSACIGACVPMTTALRWITVLETSGLLERCDDPTDARRSFVRLTRKGITLMKRHFEAKY